MQTTKNRWMKASVLSIGLLGSAGVWAGDLDEKYLGHHERFIFQADNHPRCKIRAHTADAQYVVDSYWDRQRGTTITWSGLCDSNGFAYGMGKLLMQKRSNTEDKYFTYDGELRDGVRHGQGKYTSSWEGYYGQRNINVYEGKWENGLLVTGKHTVVNETDPTLMRKSGEYYIGSFKTDDFGYQGGWRFKAMYKWQSKHGYGKWVLPETASAKYGYDGWEKVGNEYIMEGWFENDKFLFACKSVEDCAVQRKHYDRKQQLARHQAELARQKREREEREEARREEQRNRDACKRHYVGKVVGRLDQYQVVGVGQTMMTVKDIVPGGDWYGRLKEVPCSQYR